MPAPFSNISIDLPALRAAAASRIPDYISDLYCKRLGYKPPYCSSIMIQPEQFGLWSGGRKTGSVIYIAPYFDSSAYESLTREGKFQYVLKTINGCMLQLCNQYGWDDLAFKKCFVQIVETNFLFCFDYLVVRSKSRRSSAFLSIEKTEIQTTVYVTVTAQDVSEKIKLYSKNNNFWQDCSYILVRYLRWFDEDRVGIDYPKGKLSIKYSLEKKTVKYLQDGYPADQINFAKMFWMQQE